MNSNQYIKEDIFSKYIGNNSLKEKQINNKAKAITKSLQIIPYPPEKAFVIFVEGKDDLPLYFPVFNENLCKIIPLWGVDNVKYIFKKFHTRHDKSKAMKQVLHEVDNQEKVNKLLRMRDENKIFGIIDLDFEKEKCINNEYSPQDYSNLFVTETNDAQILLLCNYGLIIFITKLCDQENVKGFKKANNIRQLFQHIILMTNYSGLARYVNKKLGKEKPGYRSLKFEILKPENVFNQYISDNRVLTRDDIIKLLFHQESENDLNVNFCREYNKKASNTGSYFSDKWDICQGHDMMRVLLSTHRIVGCGKCYTYENDLMEDICNIFHLPKNAFFRKTSLFKALYRWEREKFPYPSSRMFSELYSLLEVN